MKRIFALMVLLLGIMMVSSYAGETKPNLILSISGVVDYDIDYDSIQVPSHINSKSKGVIPVTILAEDENLATVLKEAFITLNGIEPAHGVGHFEDVDKDGDMDWVGHFRTQDVINNIGYTPDTSGPTGPDMAFNFIVELDDGHN